MSQDSPPEPLHPRRPDPVAPAPKKQGSDLPARLLTAAILMPLVLYVTVLGGLAYLGVVIVFVLLGQREFYRLIEDKGGHAFVAFGMAAGAALPVVAYLGNEYHAMLVMNATLLAVMVRSVGRAEIAQALVNISGTFFGVFYIGWLLSHMVVLRNFYHVAVAKYGAAHVDALGILPESGVFYTIFCLAAVVFSDAGAYFAGHAWGRRKLAPRISPGKTVEGAIGGIAGGTLGALAMKLLFDAAWPGLSGAMSYRLGAVMAFVVAIFAIVGDLVESLLKRDAQTKDAGNLLPGMGGILDRIDSPLLGVPVMYYMLLLSTYLRMGAS
ncbi:MAG: CDP-archaeol synthase [Deltaproteobacteria bacterium]|nr:CDP-archaeol synthase [Deltaproteobacteria bacterium]MBW2361660.1 CDP-archaeol synthase [Deltaproteobacteria bacterium]